MAYLMAGEGRRLYGAHDAVASCPNKLRHDAARAVGVCGLDHALELPGRDPVVEVAARARRRQHASSSSRREETPGCATAFVEALVEAGLPAGVVNLVHGTGEEAGAALVAHPDVAVISFTGSRRDRPAHRGRRRPDAEARPPGARRQERRRRPRRRRPRLRGRARSSGRPTARRASAAPPPAASSCRRASTTSSSSGSPRARSGCGSATAGTTASRWARWSRPWAVEKVEQYVKIGQDEGATLVAGGRRPTDPALAKGYFFEPTVFAGATPDDAHRAGGDLRARDGGDPREGPRRGDRGPQRDAVRPLGRDHHARPRVRA